ncbi:MAG: hypothetical protein JWM96_577 [Alphaproteobacteria bacterium]|nr:hypothetical protein [Alphaproteobacteria bacterium]
MSLSVSPILSRYIGKRFLLSFGVIYGGLLGVIFLVDSIELLRALAKYDRLSLTRLIGMTVLKLPEVGLDLMPFAVLIAAVFTFWRLTRTSELVVVRATGVSAWQFLFAPIVIGLLLAIIKMTLLNPIGAAMISRFEHLEARYFTASASIVNISHSGLWLRQKITDKQVAILHADNVKLPEWSLTPVTAFFFDEKNILTYRIDGKSAMLDQGQWKFHEAWVNQLHKGSADRKPVFYKQLNLPTAITIQDIVNRFTSPRTIAFWNLPEYANIMKATGFEANPLWARFYSLLAEPFLNTALIIIAAALALRSPRMQNGWWLVLSTIAIGFIIFFLGDFLEALGVSDKMPLTIAAFVPATVSLLMGLTALLYLEDG